MSVTSNQSLVFCQWLPGQPGSVTVPRGHQGAGYQAWKLSSRYLTWTKMHYYCFTSRIRHFDEKWSLVRLGTFFLVNAFIQGDRITFKWPFIQLYSCIFTSIYLSICLWLPAAANNSLTTTPAFLSIWQCLLSDFTCKVAADHCRHPHRVHLPRLSRNERGPLLSPQKCIHTLNELIKRRHWRSNTAANCVSVSRRGFGFSKLKYLFK